MMLYKIILFMFVFGAVCSGINASGIFTMTIPTQSTATVQESQITDLTNSTKGPVSPLSAVSFTMLFVGSILGGLLAVLTIIPLMMSWGVPLWVATIFQTPIWIVEVAGIYRMVTGIDIEG